MDFLRNIARPRSGRSNRVYRLGCFVAMLLATTMLAKVASADDELSMDPEDQASRSHNLSQSDVMYQQEDFRALYYQNLEIIQLLQEIRDEMHNLNVRDAKNSK